MGARGLYAAVSLGPDRGSCMLARAMRRTARRFASLVLLAPLVSPTPTEGTESAPNKGRILASLRYRYEAVDQIGLPEDGEASTLRTALGYETPAWRQMRLLVEFEDVTDLGLGHAHDNGATGHLDNGVTGRPVIADPEDTDRP